MTTWILRHPIPTDAALRVAVKDLIDVAGEPTTAGSRAVERRARPAERDASCLDGLREAISAGRAAYAGRTNLHELAYGISGVNPGFGTPVNPLDPARVPGGSSSGSAVAVATGEADIGFGTDTGGSIRIPAACCGVAGLKTTHGRVGLGGVWPLAPSLDTVGPIARDVTGLVAGMGLLEAGFTPGGPPTRRVGRLRLPPTPAPAGPRDAWDLRAQRATVEAAVDAALGSTGWEVVPVELPGTHRALLAAMTILDAEAWVTNGDLARTAAAEIGADVLARLQQASSVTAAELDEAEEVRGAWSAELGALLGRPGRPGSLDLLATPTLTGFPPRLDASSAMSAIRGINAAVNLAGLPALALPVPSDGPLPASLQLIGPSGSEERILAAGAVVEASVGQACR